MCNVNFNEEKNGIELMFDEKPDAETLETIKAAGFRWHRQKKNLVCKAEREDDGGCQHVFIRQN